MGINYTQKHYNKYSTEVCTVINDTDTESNIAEQERRNIEDLGSVEPKNPRGNIHCLNIIGQV